MKKIRIGNDIVIKWRITINGEEVNLEGLDLSLYISTTYQPRKAIAFTVAGNEITATYKGTEQKVTGVYRLTLYRNEGENAQSILDACDAFELVSCSCLTTDVAFGGAEVELPIADLGIGVPGLSAYEIACIEGFEGTQAEWLASLSAASEAAAAECREFTEAAKIDEKDRQDNEALRVTAENERAAAETARQSSEANRLTNERNRTTAESQRVTNETARSNAESNRATSETARQEAETARQEAEQGRVTAEQQRVEAEAARAEEFAGFTATLAAKEDKANKVTSINADADDVHYPSAKAVWSVTSGLTAAVSELESDVLGATSFIECNNISIGTSNLLLPFSSPVIVENEDVVEIKVDGYKSTNAVVTCYLFDSNGGLLSNDFYVSSSTSSIAVFIIKSGTLKSMSLRAASSIVLSATFSIQTKKGLKERIEETVTDYIAEGTPSLCIVGKDGGILFSDSNKADFGDHEYCSKEDIEEKGGFVDGAYGEEGTFYGLPANLSNGIKISFDVEFAKELQNKTGKSVNFMNIGGYHSAMNGNITARFMSPNTEKIQVANEVRILTDDGRKLVRYNNYLYPYEDAFMGNIAFSIKGDNKTVTIDDYGLYVYSKEDEALLFSVPFEGHETLRSWSNALSLSANNNGVDVELFDVENKTTNDLLMQNKIDISNYPLYERTVKEGRTNIEVILRSDSEKQYIDMFVDGQIALGSNAFDNTSALKYKQSYVVIGGEGVKVSNIKVYHNDIARTSPRLIVVMLHSIRPDNYQGDLGMWITPSLLRAELDLFAKYGYENISIEDVVEYMRCGKDIPKRAFAIIHDDGYYFGSQIGIKEFEDVRRMYYNRNIKAGFAIIPSYLNGSSNKEGIIARLKKDSNLFSFGVHGYEHEVWPDLSFEEAKEKLSLAISLFEELIGYSPRFFVYPTNNYGWRNVTNLFENSQFSVAFANNTESAHYGVGRSCCKMAISRIDGAQSMDVIESLIK